MADITPRMPTKIIIVCFALTFAVLTAWTFTLATDPASAATITTLLSSLFGVLVGGGITFWLQSASHKHQSQLAETARDAERDEARRQERRDILRSLARSRGLLVSHAEAYLSAAADSLQLAHEIELSTQDKVVTPTETLVPFPVREFRCAIA